MTVESQLDGICHPDSIEEVDHGGLIGDGSGFGALVGGLAGGGESLLIGAGAGAAAGTTGAALTGKKNVYLPVETVLTFQLNEALLIKIRVAAVS